MRPTRSDVAKLAGVSVATVSYVVNNGPRTVTEDTRARVNAAIEQLGYRPHAIARSLRTGSTQTIGLLVPSLLPYFLAQLATAVEDNLVERGYGLILVSSHEHAQRERDLLEILTDRAIDGLLCVPTSARNAGHINKLISDGTPLVFIDRYIPGVPADVVVSDNFEAAKTATNYLIQQGCKDIVCISFSEDASSAVDRVGGYRAALAEHDLPDGEQRVLVVQYATGGTVESSLADYAAAHGLPDGILCTSDSFLTHTIKTLRELGVTVPGDVKVTGGFTSSTSPWYALLDTPPAIVRQDAYTIAKCAVERLMERIAGDERPPQTDVIVSEFVTPTSAAQVVGTPI